MTQMQQPDYSSGAPRRPNAFSGAILGLLLVTFILGFGYASYLFFQTTRTILINTPQLVRAQSSGAVIDEVTGAVTAPSDTLMGTSGIIPGAQSSISDLLAPIWNEQEPINILLLGIDQRPGEKGYYRTDTMMLVNIDPKTGNIGILSMPRDLWVNVPGFGEDRINSAHVIGDLNKYPGGGPALAKETVSELVSKPVHFYVRVNFEGFRTLLEEIGCIDIDVPFDINDPEFPDDNYGFDPFYIEAGHHCVDADTALKYARTRHVDSDFGRMERQQQVILAVKDKVLSAGQLPHLLSRLPTLLGTLSDSVQTDMPASQQITLANLARKLNTDNIRRLVIDRSLTKPNVRESGAYVLLPETEALQPALESFFDASQILPPEPLDGIRSDLAEENAQIAVLNGTANPDLGREVAVWLAEKGYSVVGYGETERPDFPQTQIIDYSAKAFTMQTLVELFALADENIRPGASDNDQVDIQIILGADFSLPSP